MSRQDESGKWIRYPLSEETKKKNNLRALRKHRDHKSRAIGVLGGKCMKCGYDKSIWALQFHHPSSKDFEVGKMLTGSWERVVKEVIKCELLCANCHAEIHHRKDI